MSERRFRSILRALAEVKSSADVLRTARELLKDIGLHLPFPGEGHTFARWKMLAEFGAHDLSVAKLAESHYDALAIIHEAGATPRPGIYGVWASKFGGCFLKGRFHPDREVWTIEGEVAFASGVSLVDFILIPVLTDEGEILFSIPRSAVSISRSPQEFWQTPGMKDADTAWVSIQTELGPESRVGEPDFYLSRRGFWMGAIGVAACWLGAAQSLFEEWDLLSRQSSRNDGFEQAARAECFIQLRIASDLLKNAAKLVDDKTTDCARLQREALMIRHFIDRSANTLLEQATRTMGPRLMVGSARFSRRALDLQVFTRQCHAEKDLVQLSQAIRNRFSESSGNVYGREVWFE